MKKYLILLIGIVSLIFPFTTFASKSGLTICSFQIAGESAYDEFISIKNDSAASLDLTGISISRKTKTATSWNTLYKFTSGTIGPYQVVTISHEKYIGVRDYVYSTSSYSLTADNSIAIIAADKTIIDLVGYGEASGYEGAVLPAVTVSEVFTRIQDTDNNLSDFVSNTKTVVLDPNASKLLITELMPAPDEGSEWLELFNPTSQAVSLVGLKLCDAMGSVHCYYFPTNAVLNPFEYKIYSQLDTKITLNNSGDWVELRDLADNLISDSGDDYGAADAGIALALIGSEFTWTKSATPGATNVFTDTVEIEPAVTKISKSTKKKVKKTSVKSVAEALPDSVDKEEAASVAGISREAEGDKVGTGKSGENDNIFLGYALIILAFILLLGYNLWENRDGIRKIYNKISRRNP